MKKNMLFMIAFALIGISATAQNKQVAIFETLGNVNQGVKSSLRNNMIYAISNTIGYEAYDRANISEIMDEHEFMNSGMVSEEGRKKLGQMIGAGYILIMEAAMDDHGQILISADLESVETGFIEKSAMKTAQNYDDMEEACTELAHELFGTPQKTSAYANEVPSNKTSIYQEPQIANTNTNPSTPNQPKKKFVSDKKHSIGIGVLQGGGGIVGADLETMLGKRLSIQGGIGLISYGFGLNIHFKPYINSSMISVVYWQQGIGDSFTQSIVGGVYTFRARKVFQFQLGAGYQVAHSSGNGATWMALYSIGLYFPF